MENKVEKYQTIRRYMDFKKINPLKDLDHVIFGSSHSEPEIYITDKYDWIMPLVEQICFDGYYVESSHCTMYNFEIKNNDYNYYGSGITLFDAIFECVYDYCSTK